MIAVALAIGLIVGALGTWFVQREELRYLRKELALATDRLVHAWKDDGARIPPRPIELPPQLPLPPELQAEVDQWDEAESKAITEARIRDLHFGRGLGVLAVLKELEAPRYAD